MATLTARVQITLPAGLKAVLLERAKVRGISLSAIMREITADVVAQHELAVVLRQIEQHGTTTQ